MKKASKFTKRQILATLKNGTATERYAMAAKLGVFNGCKVGEKRGLMCTFIHSVADTQRLHNEAYSKAYVGRVRYCEAYNEQFELHRRKVCALKEVRKVLSKKQVGAYDKLPIKGCTSLYMTSPAYGHKDYNKWRVGSLEELGEFSEKILALSLKAVA